MDNQLRQLARLAQQGDLIAEGQYLLAYSRLNERAVWLWLLSELMYAPAVNIIPESKLVQSRKKVYEVTHHAGNWRVTENGMTVAGFYTSKAEAEEALHQTRASPDAKRIRPALLTMLENSNRLGTSHLLINGFYNNAGLESDLVDLCIILYFDVFIRVVKALQLPPNVYEVTSTLAKNTQAKLSRWQQLAPSEVRQITNTLTQDLERLIGTVDVSTALYSGDLDNLILLKLQDLPHRAEGDIIVHRIRTCLENAAIGVSFSINHLLPPWQGSWSGSHKVPELANVVQDCWIPWILKEKFDLG